MLREKAKKGKFVRRSGWRKKLMASTIIPHGCQFHADTFQQCVTIHTCIVINSYIKEQQKETNPKQIVHSCICSLFESFCFGFWDLFCPPIWYQCFHLARRGSMLSGRWRRRYEAVINSTPPLFWSLFLPPLTLLQSTTHPPLVMVTYTSNSRSHPPNVLVRHVLVSSLSNGRPKTHWKGFWWWSHITARLMMAVGGVFASHTEVHLVSGVFLGNSIPFNTITSIPFQYHSIPSLQCHCNTIQCQTPRVSKTIAAC